jgi:hypothetical protein
MTFEVDDPAIKALLQKIGRELKDQMPKGWGFSLLVFSYGEDGAMFYLSSAQRADMILAMQEFIQRQSNS